MNRPGENLFRAVCLGFSLLLLVGSLLWDIRLAALNDLAAAEEPETERLKAENARLLARCESSLSLEEIERYAVEELGMQRLCGRADDQSRETCGIKRAPSGRGILGSAAEYTFVSHDAGDSHEISKQAAPLPNRGRIARCSAARCC